MQKLLLSFVNYGSPFTKKTDNDFALPVFGGDKGIRALGGRAPVKGG